MRQPGCGENICKLGENICGTIIDINSTHYLVCGHGPRGGSWAGAGGRGAVLGGGVVAAVHGAVVGEVSAGVALQPGPGARSAEDVTRAADKLGFLNFDINFLIKPAICLNISQ